MAYEISDSPSEPFDRSRAIRGPRQGFLWGLLVLADAVGCEWAPIISARLGGDPHSPITNTHSCE